MSSKAPTAPPAPDPVATARAQSEFNIEGARQTANMNRVDQFTPQGSLTYAPAGSEAADAAVRARQQSEPGWDSTTAEAQGWRESVLRNNGGGPDRWQSTTTLSPEQQRLYDQSTEGQALYGDAALSQLRSVQDTLSQPFQYTPQDRTGQLQYGPNFAGIGDPNQSRDAVQEALLARINPDLERERSQLESRLANQGITMGSQAWNTGMQDYGRQANDARYGAILNAGQEQSRMFGLGMGQAQANNAAVGQASGMDQNLMQQLLAMRSQPINEASALLSGGQVQMPQFQNVPQVQVQAPDYAGGVGQNYAGATSQWGAATQRAGANNQATAGAGASAAMAAATVAAAFI